MPKIRELSPHVADLIAAGEVVERPASVVKELLENAIDAGATAVTVEISAGGMTLIRVTDNGCGIAEEDVAVAFRPHATSKIRDERDLESISTLGFRGEALAAISSVSRVELLTKTEVAPMGTSLIIEGGTVVEQEDAGCPDGTTFLVRNLFYNTPARLKFMKRDAAEGAAVFATVQRCALSHPEVALRFLREGETALQTPGDGQLKSAIYSVFGRDLALGFTPVSGSGESMSVSGFVSLPTCCRGTRGYQHFFVNGRYIRSRTMQAAVEEAYKNQKMVGKFPGCVLHLQTRLSAVDVNVHPTKTEVKFVSDKQVFDAIYYAVLASLGEGQTRPAAVLAPPVAPVSVPVMPVPPATSSVLQRSDSMTLRDVLAPGVSELRYTLPLRPQSAAPQAPAPTFRIIPPEPVAPEPVAPEPVAPEPAPWRMAGEVLNTYIIVEQGERVLFIDKHAAHERMQFDQLKAQDYRPMAQQLLTPLVLTPAPEEGDALLQNLPLLAEFGFEAEDFGGGALIIRQSPGDIPLGDLEATLTELAQRFLNAGSANPAAQRDELLHTIACKAAIKGGQQSSPEELRVVAEAVVTGRVKFCPHGRPVAIELTKAQLEKQFKRA